MSKQRTITYVNNSNGVLLDSEATGSPTPQRGQLVGFLRHDGVWQVSETECDDEGRLGEIVYVDRRA